MDTIDHKILALLQRDASLPVADIADEVGLSTTPCWRRIQNLEKAGIIKARVALLDRGHLNLGVTVFVRIKTARHDAEWLDTFARKMEALDEVVEVYRMSGDVDYLLRVIAPDIAGFDAFYKRLISIDGLADVSSNFAMEEIKYTTALPIGPV